MHDVELSPEVAARVDALLDSIDLEPLARALVGAVAGAWERRLAEREEHMRDCVTCLVGGPDGMCGDGKRLEERVSLAMTETTAIHEPAAMAVADRAPAPTNEEVSCHEISRRTVTPEAFMSFEERAAGGIHLTRRPCAASPSTIRRDSETPDRL